MCRGFERLTANDEEMAILQGRGALGMETFV